MISMNCITEEAGDSEIVKNALESLKHFENFEEKLREARRELQLSRKIQIDNRPTPYEESAEDRLIWEIYEKFSEISANIESIKAGDMEEEFWQSC